MSFKLLFWSLFVLHFASSASSLTMEESLEQDLESAYEALDVKYGKCREQRKERFTADEVHNEWLFSLDKDLVGTAVYVLSNMAFQRCVAAEEGVYNTALIAYVADGGDKKVLDDWLRLKRLYRDDDLKNRLSQLDFNTLKKLSTTAPFDQPFNGLTVIELIKGPTE